MTRMNVTLLKGMRFDVYCNDRASFSASEESAVPQILNHFQLRSVMVSSKYQQKSELVSTLR